MRSGPLAESEGRSRDLELREGVEARLLSAPVESVPPVINKAAKVVDARAIGLRVAGRLIRKAGAREMVAQIRNVAVRDVQDKGLGIAILLADECVEVKAPLARVCTEPRSIFGRVLVAYHPIRRVSVTPSSSRPRLRRSLRLSSGFSPAADAGSSCAALIASSGDLIPMISLVWVVAAEFLQKRDDLRRFLLAKDLRARASVDRGASQARRRDAGQ